MRRVLEDSESRQIRHVSVFAIPVEENYGTHFSIPFVRICSWKEDETTANEVDDDWRNSTKQIIYGRCSLMLRTDFFAKNIGDQIFRLDAFALHAKICVVSWSYLLGYEQNIWLMCSCSDPRGEARTPAYRTNKKGRESEKAALAACSHVLPKLNRRLRRLERGQTLPITQSSRILL